MVPGDTRVPGGDWWLGIPVSTVWSFSVSVSEILQKNSSFFTGFLINQSIALVALVALLALVASVTLVALMAPMASVLIAWFMVNLSSTFPPPVAMVALMAQVAQDQGLVAQMASHPTIF